MKQESWSKSLLIGVPAIDAQHKTLIERLNGVNQAVSVRQGARTVLQALDFMEEYAELHFNTEEALMQARAYPGLAEHLVQHGEFKNAVSAIQQDIHEEGSTPEIAEAIQNLLINWFVKHIQTVNRKLGKFLAKQQGL